MRTLPMTAKPVKTRKLHYPLFQLLIKVSNNPPGAKLPRMQSIIVGRQSDPYHKWIRKLLVRAEYYNSVLSIEWICVGLNA